MLQGHPVRLCGPGCFHFPHVPRGAHKALLWGLEDLAGPVDRVPSRCLPCPPGFRHDNELCSHLPRSLRGHEAMCEKMLCQVSIQGSVAVFAPLFLPAKGNPQIFMSPTHWLSSPLVCISPCVHSPLWPVPPLTSWLIDVTLSDPLSLSCSSSDATQTSCSPSAMGLLPHLPLPFYLQT